MTNRSTDTRPPNSKPGSDHVADDLTRDKKPAAGGITLRASQRASSSEEAERRYVAARDAWSAAMRASASGRPADLAALAVAQEQYEEAIAERERWASGNGLAAIPVEGDRPRTLSGIVEQELARRRVQEHSAEEPSKGLRGLFRRRRGH